MCYQEYRWHRVCNHTVKARYECPKRCDLHGVALDIIESQLPTSCQACRRRTQSKCVDAPPAATVSAGRRPPTKSNVNKALPRRPVDHSPAPLSPVAPKAPTTTTDKTLGSTSSAPTKKESRTRAADTPASFERLRLTAASPAPTARLPDLPPRRTRRAGSPASGGDAGGCGPGGLRRPLGERKSGKASLGDRVKSGLSGLLPDRQHQSQHQHQQEQQGQQGQQQKMRRLGAGAKTIRNQATMVLPSRRTVRAIPPIRAKIRARYPRANADSYQPPLSLRIPQEDTFQPKERPAPSVGGHQSASSSSSSANLSPCSSSSSPSTTAAEEEETAPVAARTPITPWTAYSCPSPVSPAPVDAPSKPPSALLPHLPPRDQSFSATTTTATTATATIVVAAANAAASRNTNSLPCGPSPNTRLLLMGNVISGRPQLVEITPRSRRAVLSHQPPPPPQQQQATPAPATAAAGPAPRRCHVAELMVVPPAAASSSQKGRPMTTSAARTTTSAGDVKVLPHPQPHQLKAKTPRIAAAKVSSAGGEKDIIGSSSSRRNGPTTTQWTSLPVRTRNSAIEDLSPPPPPKQKPVDIRDPDWMAKQGLRWEAHGLGILSAVMS